jgi:hypothetical protein
VKLAAHGVDVCKRQFARVRAIGEQDEDALVFGVDPERCTGEAAVAEAVRW